VAKDGIVIKAKRGVTVRTNLERFVGGATEETIIARVAKDRQYQSGSSQSYKDVLENPDRISKTVLTRPSDSIRPSKSFHRHRGRRCRRRTWAANCRRNKPRATNHRPGYLLSRALSRTGLGNAVWILQDIFYSSGTNRWY